MSGREERKILGEKRKGCKCRCKSIIILILKKQDRMWIPFIWLSSGTSTVCYELYRDASANLFVKDSSTRS